MVISKCLQRYSKSEVAGTSSFKGAQSKQNQYRLAGSKSVSGHNTNPAAMLVGPIIKDPLLATMQLPK